MAGCLDSDVDPNRLMTNPNKFDEIDSDFMLDQVVYNYYTCEETNSLLNNAGTNSLAVMHFNIRSLPKI
jgi:hypothetical protein